jgi:hypothetical protein
LSSPRPRIRRRRPLKINSPGTSPSVNSEDSPPTNQNHNHAQQTTNEVLHLGAGQWSGSDDSTATNIGIFQQSEESGYTSSDVDSEVDDDEEEADDDESIHTLIPRAQPNSFSDDSESDEDSIPDASDSEDDDDVSIPDLIPRATTHFDFDSDSDSDIAADDDDDEDDDDSIPGLIPRAVDDDDDSIPGPIPPRPGPNASDSEGDDDVSIPSLIHRAVTHFEFDSESDAADDGDDDGDDDDDDDDSSIPGLIPQAARRRIGRPLAYVDDPHMATHVHSFQDYEYPSSNESTDASSATQMSKTFQVRDVSEFPISEILLPEPTIIPPDDRSLEPPTAGPTGAPDVGSNHEQVLESWRSIFNTPTPPSAAPPEHAVEKPAIARPPRFRQERIPTMDKDSNIPYGDSLRKKTPGFSRVYYINPHGISAYRDFLDLCEMLQSFKEVEVDALCFPEINLDLLKPDVRKRCEDIWNDFFGTSLLVGSTSNLHARNAYKPGGTFTGIMHSLCGRYQTSGSDPHGLGRWSFVQLYGKDGKSLVMITAYRVCNGDISSSGTSTAFHQQWHILRLAGKLRPNPRKQFITDLTIEIKKWQQAGADIILGGDFNERLGDTQDGLAQLVTQCGLVDVHASNHGVQAEPNTYSRGSKRIDYIFVSPSILDHVDICGIQPFHSVINSDHRGLFVDLDLKGILGGEMASIVPPKLRGVSSKTEEPGKYILALHKHLTANNVFRKSVGVFEAARQYHRVPADLVTTINKFDRTITQGMLLAEIRCRRKRKPAWSDALAAASTTVRFWKTRISGIQTNQDVSLTLFTIGKALRWDIIPLDSTLDQARAGLKAATTGLSQCRKRATELRIEFLDARIEAAAIAEDSTVEKMLKQIKHREAQTKCFRKLSYVLKPAGSKGGVTKVEVVIDGQTVAYTEKTEVEQETQARNKRHFNQAAGSPFTIFPLSEVGVSATNFKTTRLPDGTRVKMPADTFLETETILDLLQRKKPGATPAKISSRISLDDFTSAIKAWKERTSTSPSGRHLGHYKLLVKTMEDQNAAEEVRQAAGEILQLMVDIMDLASDKGFILDRWTTVINVMIYKKPGVYLMSKLRVIHLFEADYNFIIGTIFGRRAMYSGVDHHSLHDSQWAQPGRQCSDVVVMRELTLAVAKLTKTPMAGFENDAAACYDRIVMNLVSAIFDRMGVPTGPLRLQEQTLLRVVHYLKTGFGTSTSSYTSDSISRIYGVGQGSKAGPVTWVAISSLLFEAQDLLGTGLALTNPTRDISHKRHSDGFVDDTTGYHGQLQKWLRNRPGIGTVFQGIQHDAQIWERLLWTTGGLLELEKCRFYIVYWKFNADGRGSMMSQAEMNTPTMLLTEGDTGRLQEVKQLDLDDAFKTLGIQMTISGNQSVQISEMKRKSDEYARGLLSVNVTPFESWTGLFSIWYGKMNYPLAATSIPRPACEKIQSKAISASLSKCGFNRHMSRAIVFGAFWFGGLGWRHIYFEEGIQHILTIIKHLRTPGPFQSLLRICLDWYQVIAGVSFCPLSRPAMPLNYTDCAWLDFTCGFLLHCSAQLLIHGITLPKLQRQHDSCIMEGLLPLNLSAATMFRINSCRLWLQVATLSDICTLQGDKIDRTAWVGSARMTSNNSEWPTQTRPCDKVWGLWRKALSDSYCTNDRRYVLASQPGRLTHGLGAWLPDSSPRDSHRWDSYIQHSTQWLYVPHSIATSTYRRLTTATRLDFGLALYPEPASPIIIPAADLPDDAVPAQPAYDGTGYRLNRFSTPDILGSPTPDPPAPSFLDYLHTLPEWKQEILVGVFQTLDHDPLGQHLLHGDRLFFCSDGGAKDHAGSFGWVIATATTILWECCGIAAGWFANSFRSEGVGQLSLLVFIDAYITYHGLQDVPTPLIPPKSTPWLRIATDNEGLIKRIRAGLATTTVFAGAALCSEYDVVNEIVEIERRLPFRLTWEHVRGHQDEKKKWYELTWMETLNVRADALATDGLTDLPGNPTTLVTLIPSSKIGLRINLIDITSKYATHIRKAAAEPDMRIHFHKHYGWDAKDFDSVDWKSHQGAIRKLSYAGKKFITKFIHQILPMGAVYHKIDPTQSITCSSCKLHPECEAHLYQCPARRVVIETFLREDLGTFLEEQHTCPALAHILLDTLHSEVLGRTPGFRNRHGGADPRFRALLQAQTNIGWSQIFQGRLVSNWAILQEDFLATHNAEFKLDRRYWTGDIWARKLISLLWLAIRAQWDLRNADRHGRTKAANHAIRHQRLITAITALHQDAPLMLATDRAVLDAEPIPVETVQNPARLELWVHRTRTIATRSKADATAAIHRTHERLTHYFKYRRKKKPTPVATAAPPTPTQHPTTHTPTTQQTTSTQNTNETDSEKPGPI